MNWLAARLDPLRDEGLLHGLRLSQAGVPVELHDFPGVYHAFGGPAAGPDPGERQPIAAEHLTALRRGLHS
ncbi:alpha/beta hydrolase fold domain-containing protein [Streptomyces sp. NPDC058382]|uniref:alpha/beta hydrolase fold domain-containing protein n=1 Tax=unclassified Streptomyces TaxID=2593676 RepID=UPI00363BE0C6